MYKELEINHSFLFNTYSSISLTSLVYGNVTLYLVLNLLYSYLVMTTFQYKKRVNELQWVVKLLGTHITQNKYYDFNSNPI